MSDRKKKSKKIIITHALNIVTVALIVESFLCTMMLIRKYAREDCISRIEEATEQMSLMFNHALDEQQDKLTVFADILAANIPNPDNLVYSYMENFCRTQNFAAVCIHRDNGTFIAYDKPPHKHPHMDLGADEFTQAVNRLDQYAVSDVFFDENNPDVPENNYFYQAVPIIQDGKTVAILYGFISLDTLTEYVSSGMYDGEGRIYIVDGTTGNYLMDEYRGTLGNIRKLADREPGRGYSYEEMQEDIRNGERGEFVFKSLDTDKWRYTYYMPLGINNWSINLTVDESKAFDAYHDVSLAMTVLMVIVIALMFIHVVALMMQNAHARKLDKARLHKSAYMNAIQRALLNAHHNAGFVDQALKLIGEEMSAETVMLLSFDGQTVTNAQYWPSTDKAQAMDMIGRNIRDDFPTIFDAIAAHVSVIYDGADNSMEISETNRSIFEALEVFNMVLVPITDPAGGLKGAIAAVNIPAENRKPEMLECVTYDFFMAITNLENHNIIKRMGVMDYLTGLKNRNSYESEIAGYITMDCRSLWCVFIDVNGLHEVNNHNGHKAGDVMLMSVAKTIKRVFGEQCTYRVGGDEFVAFAMNSTSEEMTRKKKAVVAELAIQGYYVSVGFEGIERNADGLFDVEQVVADAESIMYDEKRKFYEKNGIPSERGHFPPQK